MLRSEGRLSLAPLVQALEAVMSETELTYTEVARRLWGPTPGRTQPDVTRLKRRLGMAPTPAAWATTIDPWLARQIAKAAHIDPVDVGL
jgi:hypothetical protein